MKQRFDLIGCSRDPLAQTSSLVREIEEMEPIETVWSCGAEFSLGALSPFYGVFMSEIEAWAFRAKHSEYLVRVVRAPREHKLSYALSVIHNKVIPLILLDSDLNEIRRWEP